MAAFPEIHPEKCVYCGKELKLVTAKYEWDYYYKCSGCGEKYPTKNGKIPNMQEVRNSGEYKVRTGAIKPHLYTPPAQAPAPATAPAPSPAPAPAAVSPSNNFLVYTVKTFCDIRDNGKFTSAGDQLQRYLNSNRIPRPSIISISSAVYPMTYGANMLVLTLVHC